MIDENVTNCILLLKNGLLKFPYLGRTSFVKIWFDPKILGWYYEFSVMKST